MSAQPLRATFIVQLKDNQNATWQGSVVWTDKNVTKPFRSALELIKLIDSAVSECTGQNDGAAQGDLAAVAAV